MVVNPRRGVRKRHMTSRQATNALYNLTHNLYTPWTLSLYRQAAIAIAKRHISELIKRRKFYGASDSSLTTRMSAAGAGHHPHTLLTAYAIDKALPARLQPELFEMYQHLSSLWQHWNKSYFKENYESCVPIAVALGMQMTTATRGTKRAADTTPLGNPKPTQRKETIDIRNQERQLIFRQLRGHSERFHLQSGVSRTYLR